VTERVFYLAPNEVRNFYRPRLAGRENSDGANLAARSRDGIAEDHDRFWILMHHMPRFSMPGPHAYCTRTPSIRPVWIGVRQLAVQRVWV
jgi:hypothetical protein